MTESVGHYQLYDLRLKSGDSLSLSKWSGEPEEDWRFEVGEVSESSGALVHDILDFDGVRRLKVWVEEERGIIFSHGGTRVLWDRVNKVIRFQAGQDLEIRPAIVLERMVAPIAMILERAGFVALHASAVGKVAGRAWIFIGNSGAGKSTTALQMMRRGFDLLADDLVMIDAGKTPGGKQELIAATPSLRLFDRPETVPEAIDKELVMPHIEKFWYQLPDRSGGRKRHEIAGIFSLEPTDNEEFVGGPELKEVRGQEASMRILAQAFDLTDGPGPWRTQRFRTLCEVARSVPVYAVRYRRDSSEAPAQVVAIAEHLSRNRAAEEEGIR